MEGVSLAVVRHLNRPKTPAMEQDDDGGVGPPVRGSTNGVQPMFGHARYHLDLKPYGHLFEGELDAVADKPDEAHHPRSSCTLNVP